MPIADPSEPDMTAAELALGLLDGDERAGAMRRVLAEPAFAREVAQWRDRLSGLFASWPDVAPPAALEDRLMRSIAPAPAAAVAPQPRGWRAAALGMSAVAAMLLGVLVLRPMPQVTPPPPPAPAPLRAPAPALAAAIAPAGATPPVPVVYDPATGTLRIAVADRLAPERRSPQLWVLGGDGTPHALAVLANGRTVTVAVPATLRATIVAGAVLAISIEPAGGAPGPLPTGPVVATGPLNRL